MEQTLIDGRYLLLAELGRGGEAQVFRARDEVTQSEVAIRIVTNSGTPRLPVEAFALSDKWVAFLAWGQDERHGFYQVFELLRGGTLRVALASGALELPRWRRFVDDSLVAVGAVHAAGWVHGDLNADNFFETEAGWKLLELPFLRPEPPPGRSTLFGSIHTLAPEQFSGKQADIQTDLYSLGCLYYFAACGEYPHPGATSQEVAIHCLRFAAVPLQEKAPGLPPACANWVMKLIAPSPQLRLDSVTAARQLLAVPVA